MATHKSVLIVSPDVPFPDNYGGALDIWRRVVHLKNMGFVVHLVSLYRDDSRLAEFEASEQFKVVDLHVPIKYRPKFSAKALVYPAAMTIRSVNRDNWRDFQHKLLPHYDYALVENSKNMLAFNDIEKISGTTCSKVYVRMQNCEWEYYDYMASAEKNILKKIFYLSESVKFKMFEKKLIHDKRVDGLLFISQRDKDFYGSSSSKALLLPVFLSSTEAAVNFNAKKNLLLFIGNLELSDNVAAVEKLYDYLQVWLKVNPQCKLVIAGKNKSGINPFSSIKERNVEVLFNISHSQKESLIEDAKIFCSFSMNPAGVKLKTLEGAASGLPILANNNACDGSGVENAVMNVDRHSRDLIFAQLDHVMSDMGTFRQMSSSVALSYRQLLNDAARAHIEIFAS